MFIEVNLRNDHTEESYMKLPVRIDNIDFFVERKKEYSDVIWCEIYLKTPMKWNAYLHSTLEVVETYEQIKSLMRNHVNIYQIDNEEKEEE